jgi:hypothetical protein
MTILWIIILVLAVCLLCWLIVRINMTPFTRNVLYIVLAVLTLVFILWQVGLLSNLGGPIRLHN